MIGLNVLIFCQRRRFLKTASTGLVMEVCVICNQSLSDGQPTVELRTKGSEGVNKASKARGSDVTTEAGQRVHVQCRKEFINPKRIASDIDKSIGLPQQPSFALRSESLCFRFNEHCLFCGTTAQPELKLKGKRTYDEVYPVRTLDFCSRLQQVCDERNDDWGKLVAGRLAFAPDLHAADAVYHQSCSVNFRTFKDIPLQYSSSSSAKRTPGRPEESERAKAFQKTVEYFEENDDEQLTVTELVQKMQEYLCADGSNQEAFSVRHMKDKLMTHFGDQIIITEIHGIPNVVTLHTNATTILYNFYKEQRLKDSQSETMRIIRTAASLIRNEIKSIDSCTSTYPTTEQMTDPAKALAYLPPTLREMLQILFTGKDTEIQRASVGQAIMQGVRPRVIVAPLQFGLSEQMHHKFASKFLVDTLHKHGFGSSYAEIQKFERSAAVEGVSLPEYVPGQFVQFVADNVDHNIRTLDGYNTFHGMGIIATFTPGTVSHKAIPRISVASDEIERIGQINIMNFRSQETADLPLTFKQLTAVEKADTTAGVDLLWDVSLALQSRRPLWFGFMQSYHQGAHPGRSSVVFLPMIDLDPGNMSCIFSTLHYICAQAKSFSVTPVITFDQPLFWKALLIIESEQSWSALKTIVLRLGGLHTEMSFLGCVGHLMAGSGLEQLLEVVYAENAVKHILSGKAIARAVRGHLMVHAALNAMLTANAYNIPLPSLPDDTEDTAAECDDTVHDEICAASESSNVSHQSLLKAGELFEGIMTEPHAAIAWDLSKEESIRAVAESLNAERDSMKGNRTAQLWLQYMNMIETLRKFVKAERVGDWMLHLQAVQEMLPYFAAAGHNLYAKSVYMYLQMMLELPETHPDIHKCFLEGLHVVRRSNRYWAGLSTDLVIEQVLMRSLKTSGGLTRGRGFTEVQRLVWLLSMPACADIDHCMQELTGVNSDSSEQHKECSQSRIKRDTEDTYKVLNTLSNLNPFGPDPSLRGLVTGLTANESVNVDNAKLVGQRILDSMVGKTITDISFQRKKQAVTLVANTAITVDDDVSVQVDPQLLFQRLSLIATSGTKDEPASYFKYELCTHPPALFDNSSLPWVADKPALADALWKLVNNDNEVLPDPVHYVLDGGALLQRLPWTKGETFESVFKRYVKYVTDRYGKATVIFDGYGHGPNTKDVTHLRRGQGSGPTVNLTPLTVVSLKKTDFLNNHTNKQSFLVFLGDYLERAGCSIAHARADADLLIVQEAISASQWKDTVLVGDDTDLLVLLLHHAHTSGRALFLRPESKPTSKKSRIWNIRKSKEELGPAVCSRLLFVHALLGCDTTSRLYGIGKQVGLSKIHTDELSKVADIFMKECTTKEDIIHAGEKALVFLYNGDQRMGLNELRFKNFSRKALRSSKHVEARDLPPTQASAKFHSMRVYYQMQEWRGKNDDLNPLEWGWQMVNQKLLPVKTDLPPAPADLLCMFRCNCRTGCASKKCTCRRNGLDCTAACGDCKGQSCSNSPKPTEELDMDE